MWGGVGVSASATAGVPGALVRPLALWGRDAGLAPDPSVVRTGPSAHELLQGVGSRGVPVRRQRVADGGSWDQIFARRGSRRCMYSVAVSRSIVAQHYLTVPDPGPEGELHSHTFTVEATFQGPELDEYGYLVDIDAVSAAMDATADSLRDETLNDLPEFAGQNPSAEHLGQVFADRLLDHVAPETATELEISVREDDVATVGYRTAL